MDNFVDITSASKGLSNSEKDFPSGIFDEDPFDPNEFSDFLKSCNPTEEETSNPKKAEKSTAPKKKRKKSQSLKPSKRKKSQSPKPSKRIRSQSPKPSKRTRSQSPKPSKRTRSQSPKPSKRTRSQSPKPSKRKKSQSPKPSKRKKSQSPKPSKRIRSKKTDREKERRRILIELFNEARVLLDNSRRKNNCFDSSHNFFDSSKLQILEYLVIYFKFLEAKINEYN